MVVVGLIVPVMESSPLPSCESTMTAKKLTLPSTTVDRLAGHPSRKGLRRPSNHMRVRKRSQIRYLDDP